MDSQSRKKIVRNYLRKICFWGAFLSWRKKRDHLTFTGTILQQSSFLSYSSHMSFSKAGRKSFVLLIQRRVESSLFWMVYWSLISRLVRNTLFSLKGITIAMHVTKEDSNDWMSYVTMRLLFYSSPLRLLQRPICSRFWVKIKLSERSIKRRANIFRL